MSKAFTREDSEYEPEITIPRRSPPTGAVQYMTADGAARLAARSAELEEERRQLPQDGEEVKSERLRNIDAELRRISEVLAAANIVPAPAGPATEVRFGAWVTVRDGDGAEEEYRIVGPDEVDLDKGWINWQSPLARALQGRQTNESASFQTIEGEKKMTVVGIRYEGDSAVG
jgi:transcription elongation factor GreB